MKTISTFFRKTPAYLLVFFLCVLSTGATKAQTIFAPQNVTPPEVVQSNFYVDDSVSDSQVFANAITPDGSTFHLISHGQSGELLLDDRWLNSKELAKWIKNENLLSGINHLNIYGCDFAKGEKGKQAVAHLEAQLGLSVSASDDITGIGGDWELEVGKAVNQIKLKDYQFNLQATPPMVIDPTDFVSWNHHAGYRYDQATDDNGSVRHLSIAPDGTIGTVGFFDTFRGSGGPNLFFHDTDITESSNYNGFSANTNLDDDNGDDIEALRDGSFLYSDWETGVGETSVWRITPDGTRTDISTTWGSWLGIGDIIQHPTNDDEAYVSMRVNTTGTYQILKFNPTTGALDSGFTYTNTASSARAIREIGFASNGNLLVSQDSYGLREVNPDTGAIITTYTGVNTTVGQAPADFALQSDGKIIVVGSDVNDSNDNYDYIARLNTDGTLDTTFEHHTGGRGVVGGTAHPAGVDEVEINSLDEIYVVGGISHLHEDFIAFSNIAKLSADGIPDNEFALNARTVGSRGANGNSGIYDLEIQDDDKLVIGGIFAGYNNLFHAGIMRMHPNGIVDTPINATAPSNSTIGLAISTPNANRNTNAVIWREGEQGQFNEAGYHPTGYSRTDDDNVTNSFLPNRFDVGKDKVIWAYPSPGESIVAHEVGGGEILWEYTVGPSPQSVRNSDISPDGKYYAALINEGTDNNRVIILDADTGTLIHQFNSQFDDVYDIGFNASGTYLYGLQTGKLERYDVSDWSYVDNVVFPSSTYFWTNNLHRPTHFEFYSDTDFYMMTNNGTYIYKQEMASATATSSTFDTDFKDNVSNTAPTDGGRIRTNVSTYIPAGLQASFNHSSWTVDGDGNMYIRGNGGINDIHDGYGFGHNTVRIGPTGTDDTDDKYILTHSTIRNQWVLYDWGAFGTTCDDFTTGAELCAEVNADPTGALALADCDGDGVTNIKECTDGTDPTDPCDYIEASITLEVTADQSGCNDTEAEDDINQTTQNVPTSGNVLTNDNDEEGDDQDITEIDTDGDGTPDTTPTAGTPVDITQGGVKVGELVIDPETGEYTFTPEPDFTGEVSIPYEVCDDNTLQACDTATLVIDVIPDYDPMTGFPPFAIDDNGTTDPSTPVTINILSNDSDPDGTIDPTTVSLDPTSVGQTCSDTDADGDCVEVTVPGEGTYTVDPTTGEVTFTPDPDFTGVTTPITYSVKDNDGNEDTATITVVVEEDDPDVNEMTAEDDANSGENDETLTGNILTNDIDPDGSDGTPSVTAALVDSDGDGMKDDALSIGTPTDIYQGGVIVGSLEINSDGTYTWDPEPTFVGTVTVPYTACDNDSTMDACDDATLVLTTVPSTNDTEAEDDINQTTQNVPTSGNILTNDNDEEGDDQDVTEIDTDGDGTPDTTPTAGTPVDITQGGVKVGELVIDPETGEYTFTPEPDFTGEVSIPYEACDDNAVQACDTATLVIDVIPDSDPATGLPPFAIDDNGTTDPSTPVTINILSNDSDPDGTIDPTTVSLDPTSVGQTCSDTDADGDCVEVTVPGEGTYTVDPTTGEVTFTPDPDFTGVTTPITYSVKDNDGNEDTATITVVVEEDDPDVNEMTAEDDANSGENDETLTGNILTNDIDPDGSDGTPSVTAALVDSDGDGMKDDALSIGTPTDIYQGGVIVGSLEINSDGTYTWDPEPTFVGTVTVPYTACDNDSTMDACDDATLVLTTVPSTNDTEAEDDINQTTQNVPTSGNILTNDNDEEGDDQDVTEIDTDGDGTPDTTPTAGTPVDITQGGVKVGELVIDPETGEYTFTPEPDFTGEVSIPYEACDDNAVQACDTATLVIDVIPSPDPATGLPPFAIDDNGTTDPSTPVTLNILSNDSDPDGTIDPTTVSLDPTSVGQTCSDTDADGDCVEVTVPGEGTYTVDPTTGEVTFTPDPDFTGVTTPITYSVEDNDGNEDTATITVVVEEDDPDVNEMTAEDDANSGEQDETLTGNILTNDIDPDGSDGTPTVTAALVDSDGDGMKDDALTIGTPTDIYQDGVIVGSLEINSDGTYTWDPEPSFGGTVTVPYTACDNDSTMNACDDATLVLTTVKDPNTTDAEDDINSTQVEVPVDGNILTNDTDDQGDDQDITMIDSNGDGVLDATIINGVPVVLLKDGVFLGTIQIDPETGDYTYTPSANFTGGEVVIPYEVCDDGTPQACDTATLVIDVLPETDPVTGLPPLAVDDNGTTDPSTPVTLNILSNDSDPDGTIDPTTVSLDPASVGQTCSDTDADGDCVEVEVPGEGTYTVDPVTGEVTFTPDPGFTGVTTPITYSVKDNDGNEDTATITVVVEEDDPDVNEMTAEDDANSGKQDVTLTGNILDNDIDPDGSDGIPTVAAALVDSDNDGVKDDPLTIGTPTSIYQDGELIGSLTINADGTYTWNPERYFVGTVTVPYTACDNDSTMNACDDATLVLTTVAADLPDLTPTITIDPNQVNGERATQEVRITVREVNSADTDGSDIFVSIPVSNFYTLDPYDSTLTTIGGLNVDNANWSYIGQFGSAHFWQYVEASNIIDGDAVSSFGFTMVFDTNDSGGEENVVVTIFDNSGGDSNVFNNRDQESISYVFQ